jgi:CBS-domain-containing membrane protein
MNKTVSEIMTPDPVIDGNGRIVGIVSIGDLAISADDDSPLASVSQALPNT